MLSSCNSFAQDSTYAQYEKRSELLIDKINTKTISEAETKELKAIAYGFQNHGQLLDDEQHDYPQSLEFTNKAIRMFVALSDTLSEANNRKFKAYLLGMLGNYKEAKQEAGMAISLYQSKNSSTGVAVSMFDLSRVYDQEKVLDSAIFFSNASLGLWKPINNSFRIFSVEMMLIHLYTKSKQYENALAIQKEAALLINDKNIQSRELADYYLVLQRLYTAINKTTEAAKYKQLHLQKIKELEEEGKSFRSYYGTL